MASHPHTAAAHETAVATFAGGCFWRMEHPFDYYLKKPLRYKLYRYHCGRDQRLLQLWGNTE